MPELPEIYHLAEQMDNELKGMTVKNISVVNEKCLNVTAADVKTLLSGRSFEQVTSRGKWIFSKLDNSVWLLINLGMGGYVLLHQNEKTLPDKFQFRIDLNDGRILTVSFWWFGYIHVMKQKDLADHKMTAGLGKTPFRDPEFTEDYLVGLLKSKRGSIKSFLLNQSNLAGIGNVYVQDILFGAGLHPDRKLPSLTANERTKLYNSIVDTLKKSVKFRGLAYERDLYNRPGGFTEFLVGYREGQPCPVCGTTIQKIKTGSTASYICPRCQT